MHQRGIRVAHQHCFICVAPVLVRQRGSSPWIISEVSVSVQQRGISACSSARYQCFPSAWYQCCSAAGCISVVSSGFRQRASSVVHQRGFSVLFIIVVFISVDSSRWRQRCIIMFISVSAISRVVTGCAQWCDSRVCFSFVRVASLYSPAAASYDWRASLWYQCVHQHGIIGFHQRRTIVVSSFVLSAFVRAA